MPVALGFVGLAVDYSNSLSFKQQLQAAADSAVLAATSGIVHGATITQAQATAVNTFTAGAPNNAPNTNAASVNATINNNLATTTLSYTGARPRLFPNLFGGSGNVVVSSQAQAALVASSSSQDQTFAGRGSIWGDPHLNGVNGIGGTFACDSSGQTYYNALSDSGFEINFNCHYDTNWSEDGLTGVVVMIGSHVISTTAAPPTYSTAADGSLVINYNGKAWFGGLTVDGTYYPPQLGAASYLNGQVTQNITDLTTPGQQDNSIVINYVNGVTSYNVTITYDEYQMGSITVSATNAGRCGVPGGMFGQTLAGAADLTSTDFSVPSLTSTTFQFNWSSCTNGNGSMSVVRLTK